ncbi:MAG: phenylalanine--tRNA ligase subunit alpha, partial [Candidatus Marsarchaeota archaeon]|nr:phenylalanine--tRNA ligase subunit alpha [Candidatus Marsarchaeota archaeon]
MSELHEYEVKILKYLKDSGSASLESLCEGTALSPAEAMWAIENLKAAEEVSVEEEKGFEFTPSVEALGYANEFPEEALLRKLKSGPVKISPEVNGIAISWCKRNGWAEISNNELRITDLGKRFAGDYKQRVALNFILSKIGASRSGTAYATEKELSPYAKEIAELKGRKLIEEKARSRIKSVKATEIGLAALSKISNEKSIAQLTREMIRDGSWEGVPFRPYDVDAPVADVYPARRHPMKEFMELVRRVWVSQGFIETNGPMIESSFWNFDVLFSPQDHPTRDMQDTFFLSNPESLDIAEKELLKRVGSMHKKGWKSWNAKASEQTVLRTHTTSVSAHNIFNYGNTEELEYPIKLFSIGKVFRNESIDYKHLAELHQLDGIVIGKNLGVSHLKWVLEQFYSKLGFKIKFKPSYFPFVEPGLEASYYDEEHGDWIELCGGGIIRKEI